MPPKQRKAGKKKEKEAEKKESQIEVKAPSEKELLLRAELEKINLQLENAKETVNELRQENEWLQNEAQKIRIESHEYMSFMERKTSKRQSAIITLNDYNRQEIRNLQLQRQNMEDEFAEKKKALENLLLEKQHLLIKTNQDLDALQEYKNLKMNQENKIHDLEQQVAQMRAQHTEHIQKMKADFLSEKQKYQQDSECKIQTLEKKANKEALQCLRQHTSKIKQDNRELRHELLQLIKTTRALNEHQRKLEEQKRQLLKEQNYAKDLRKLREARQKRSHVSLEFPVDENGEEVTITNVNS